MDKKAIDKIEAELDSILDLSNFTGVFLGLDFEKLDDDWFEDDVKYLVKMKMCNDVVVELEMGYNEQEDKVFVISGEDTEVSGLDLEKQIVVDIIYELTKQIRKSK